MRRHAVICVLLLALSLTGCSSNESVLREGDTYRTQSGLAFTLPEGASATVSKVDSQDLQPDVPFTEMVDITLDENHAVVILSFKDGDRNSLDATLVAGSPESEVALYDQGAKSIRATIETQVDDAAVGRVILLVPAGGTEGRSSLALSRWVWDRLEIRGLALPTRYEQ